MSDCQCELSGFCSVRNIAMKRTYQMICKENKPRLDAILAGETWVQPKAVVGPQRRSCGTKKGKCTDCSNAGTLLMAAIQEDTGQPVSCGSCKTYLMSLNRMSSHDHATIVQKLYAEISWTQSWRKKYSDKETQKSRIGEIVSGVLASATTACVKPKPVRVPGVRVPGVSGFHNHRVMKLSTSQTQLRDAAQSAPPPRPDPFTDTPVIHFGAHMWPLKQYWRWHAKLWRELAETINGRCVVGIVTDDNTAPIEEVQAALGDRFELFVSVNTPQGENPTFRELQNRIPQGQNDVLIYAHAKGVREHTAASEPVRIWTECMYETVVFNTTKVVHKLSEGYKCFGSFRSFGSVPLTPVNSWHYSGTFFAVRAKHIGRKTVKTGYGGVEAWCGDHIPAAEAWNEFVDSPGFKFGYDLAAVYPAIVDAQMQWEANRIGGIRCEQHKRELDWFVAQLKATDRMLVIGSKHGGLESAIKRRLPDVTTVAIDIAPQADNSQVVIVGSSTDPDVQRKAREAGPFDVVFIDGDHSYAGAKADWEFAISLRPPLIAFHDIADAIKHRNEGCHVDRLWSEIKNAGHRTDEKIVGCGWGGIGIVWRDKNARNGV